jgi:predicted metal-dependent enzyme (double-stranded beta helix superfamily)
MRQLVLWLIQKVQEWEWAAEPSAVLKGIGEPRKAGVEKLYHADDLTIINVIWAPMMTIMPHEHRMWAVIGVYTGREDNMFWRRIDSAPGPTRVEAVGARALSIGDAEPLDRDIIHSVINPIPRLTGAIHVYGGDFFAVSRSEWDAERCSTGSPMTSPRSRRNRASGGSCRCRSSEKAFCATSHG